MANAMLGAHSLRRFLAVAVVLVVLAVGFAPRAALAEGDEYEVSSGTYESVVEQIKENVVAGSDVTLVLTEDLGLKSSSYQRAPVEFGIEGYHVTYKSAKGGPYALGASSYYLQGAIGDVTFDNVWLAVGQHQERDQGTVSSFYANGHAVEFTESFSQPIASLYGGSSGESVDSTHLIINGDLIAGGDSPGGASQNWKVYGGGCYSGSGNSASDGRVVGDVVIELGAHSRVPWVYGGGKDAPVGGGVTITLRGDASDPNHHVGNITGGGSVTKDAPDNASCPGRYAGTVGGDVTINLESGRCAGLASGGSYVSSGSSVRSTPEDIQKLNDRYEKYDYLFSGTVAGDVNVTMGREGDAVGTLVLETSVNNSGGSTYSVIQGDVSLTVDDGAKLQDLQGMGRNDIVEGAVSITINGGEVEDTVWGLGEAWYSSEGAHEVGRSDDPDEDNYYPKDAVTITLNGGSVGSIAWFEQYLYDGIGAKYGTPQVYGNVVVNVNGGEVGRVYVCNPSEADPTGWASGHKELAYVRGDKGIELHVRGGKFTSVPSIYAYSLNSVYRGQRIYFENDSTVYLYQIVGANASNNEDYAEATGESGADIIVDNSAPATLMYYTRGGSTRPVFGALDDEDELCGSIDIQSGTLAMAGEAAILGDLTISDKGTLTMPTAELAGVSSSLNVGGRAAIDDGVNGGQLQTTTASIYNWSSSGASRVYSTTTEASPAAGEVYVRSMDTNETAEAESDAELLDLDSAPGVAAGLYVEYTQQDAALTAGSTNYSHAWRIAQGKAPEVEEYHVLYGFKTGTRGASLPDAVTDLLPTDGATYAMGETVTAIQPAKTSVPGPKHGSEGSPMGVWTFTGYDADSKVVSDETLEGGFGSDTSLYIKFEGTWKWTEGAFTVSYSWSGLPEEGTALYDASGNAVTLSLPKTTEGHYRDEVVTVDTTYSASIVYYTHDQDGNVNGSYTFSGWSSDDVSISEDGNFTMPAANVELKGTWIRNEMGQDQLTYDKNADAAKGATGPTVGYEGETVTVAENGFNRPGFRFTGWNTQPDGEGTGYAPDDNYALTDGDDVLYAQWECAAAEMAPKATSLVAYEGGEGSSANPDDALPEPVWRFEAENWTLYVNGVRQAPGASAFQWGYFAAGSETEQTNAAQKGVYELHAWPLEDDPEVVAKGSDGSWYILDLDGDTTVVDEDGNAVTVSVRDVVNGEEAEELSEEVLKPVVAGGGHAAVTRAACAEGGAHAHVASGAGFEKNGIDGLPVADPSKVSLLYDELIPNVLGGADRMGALDEKARAAVGGEFASGDYGKAFKYLDLVDKSDGNLWVATADGSDTTVFIPYSGDMTADKTISAVRFTGLTRDYTVGGTDDDVDAAVSASSAIELDVVKSDGGITFTVPSGQFGPIELMWAGDSGAEDPDIPNPPVIDPDEPDDPDTPDTPDTPDEPDTPDTPDTPEPDQPDVPDTPEPGEPGTTGTPSEPAKPADPGATIPRTGDPLAAVAALGALAGAGAIGAGAALRRRR